MADDSITLLHLSDPQFGRNHLFGSSGLTLGDQHFDSLFARLHADLRGLKESTGLIPEMVVVSGDLAEWARPGEFDQVLEFLKALTGALEVPRRRIVVVPGNHDISRPACQAYFLQCEANEEPPKVPFWPKWELFAAMFRRFYDGEEAISFDVDQPWTLFELSDLRVVVAGLNSTMAESHRDEDHYGWVGEQQLEWFAERLRSYEQRGWLRLGVLHHNVVRGAVADDENLRDAPDLERILAPRLNLLLHGHTHDAKRHRLGDLLVLSTGSAAVVGKARPAEVPNQYQFVRIHAYHVERWGRCYALNEKRWIGDTRISQDGNDWHEGRNERLLAVHETFPGASFKADMLAEREHLQARSRDDEFLTQVAEVCALRNPGAVIKHRTTQTIPPFPYLRVVVREDGLIRQYPIGTCEHGATAEDVDRFVRQVHTTFKTADPFVFSKLVYGGEPADEQLVQAAWRQGVDLVSFIEYQGVLDLRGYVAKQTTRLQSDRIYPPQLYVPQRFRLLDAEDGPRDDLLEQMLEWVDAPQGRFILVLGDFGRGKTFLLHQLARRIPKQLPHLIPLLIQLRALEKARTLDELIAQHLAAAGEAQFDLRGFHYMLREGRIVLLFDGFDELALRVASYDRATDHLETLLQAAEGRAKVVVSSRTQHFISDKQVTTALGGRVELLPGRRLVTIEDFDGDQIRAFLTKLYDGDERKAKDRLDLLRDIRDLLGLSRNPRMLSFIADLPDDQLRKARERHGEITSAELYRLLLERWLKYEQRRAQPKGAPTQLEITERWEAVTRLALRLWQTTERTAGLSDLTSTVTDTLGELADRQVDLHQAAHAVGSGTLLVRSEDGEFTFVHQSVMEWLVARHAADVIQRGDPDPEILTLRKMSTLMADFLLGLLGREQGRDWANHVRRNAVSSESAKANALLVLDRLGEQNLSDSQLAGQDLRGASLSGRNLRGADLHDADLFEAHLVGSDLSGANLRGANLRRANLNGAILVEADLTSADLTGARLLGTDLRSSLLDSSRWRRTGLLGADINISNLVRLDTYGAALPGTHVDPQISRSLEALAQTVSPDGELLAVAGDDGAIRIIDLMERKLVRTLHGHHGSVLGVAFSPDGQQLATGGAGGMVRLWDVATGEPRHTLQGHKGRVFVTAFSPDGQQLASAGGDGSVRLWDVATGKPRHTLRSDRGGDVLGVAFSPDGQQLASAGRDGIVRLWDVATGEPLHTFQGHTELTRSVAFTPDGQQLASAGGDGIVRLWDVATGEPGHILQGQQGTVYAVAFSPDGQQLASASDDGTVRLWNRTTGEPHTLRSDDGSVMGLAFSPDGQQLATGGGMVRLWDVATRKPRHSLQGHQGTVWRVAFTPDGQQLASAGGDGSVRLWDVATGEPGHILQGQQGTVYAVAFSPDGLQLASAGSDGTVRLWDVATGKPRHTLRSDRGGGVLGVAFSPDGQQLATGGAGGMVRLWDVATRKPRHILQGHQGIIYAVAFSPDGLQLASAGSDGTVRLWHLHPEGWSLSLIPLPEGWAVMTTDGRYKLEGIADGELWFAAGLCRFEPGELDPFVPSIRRLPKDAPLFPAAANSSSANGR